MGTRVSYPVEVKYQAVIMRLEGICVKQIMEQLNIKNKTQLMTWMRWYKNGEMHRFNQPVGKQYSYGKGLEFENPNGQVASSVKSSSAKTGNSYNLLTIWAKADVSFK